MAVPDFVWADGLGQARFSAKKLWDSDMRQGSYPFLKSAKGAKSESLVRAFSSEDLGYTLVIIQDLGYALVIIQRQLGEREGAKGGRQIWGNLLWDWASPITNSP